MNLIISIFFCVLFCHECTSSIYEWFGWKSPEELPRNIGPLLEIPFEELGPEDKFLVEANKITGLKLSQLDACQHKLIMKIKSSCGSLSDEDLSKLSVNLLNCQADVEGRKTFPCTEEMSLRDCTSEMDAETWNAYHVMCNRARAVCYAARQEQFRALAEMTVNKLVGTARSHIDQMTTLNTNQEKLEKATEIALERISRSQHDVLATYSRLRRLESDFASSLIEDRSGIEELGLLINNERNKITEIVADFKRALEETQKEYKNQRKMKSIEHEKVLKDLAQIQSLTQEVNKQLGNVQMVYDQNFLKSLSQFNETFQLLAAVNKSLNEISSRLLTLQKLAVDKTFMILSYIGSNGENIDVIFLAGLHLICLSAAMIICSFMELPRRIRAMTVASSSVNIYLSLSENEYAVSLSLLYTSLSLITIVDFVVLRIYTIIRHANRSKDHLSKYKQDKIANGIQKPASKVDEWLTDKVPDNFGLKNGSLLYTPLSKDHDEGSVSSRASLRSRRKGISPARSAAGSTTSGKRSTCTAIRLNGLRCKLPSSPGQSTCRVHENSR